MQVRRKTFYKCFKVTSNILSGKFSYFRCNLPEIESKRRVLKPSAGDVNPVELCFKMCHDMKSMIEHMNTYHSLHLKPIRDFCETCEIIFDQVIFVLYEIFRELHFTFRDLKGQDIG